MSQTAIVTGGSTGIGRSTAIALAKSGHDVAITFAHSEGEARETAKAVEAEGQRCIVAHLDLSSPDTANPCVDELVDQLGGLDVVVSNAGMMVNRKMPDLDLETATKIFNVNTLGALLVIQRAVHHMLPNGIDGEPRTTPGRVIVVTSVHEEIASPSNTFYTMTNPTKWPP